MNEQKDAVQDAVEALELALHDVAYNKIRAVQKQISKTDPVGKILIELLDEALAALKSSPVDVEKLKKQDDPTCQHPGLYNEEYKGWNACLDHLTKNGYRITKGD